MKKLSHILIYFTSILFLSGCSKNLDEKPDIKLAIPVTLEDFQALLDRYPVINNSDPSAGEISAGDYFLTDADYLSLPTDNLRNLYSWQQKNLFVPELNDWYYCYRPVFTSNTALKGLEVISAPGANQAMYNNVMGQALFIRGKSFLLAAGLWAEPFDQNTAGSKLGIPLKLSVDFNEKSVRSTLKETYDQIINDLTKSAALLPVTTLHVMRPSKPAAFGILARLYLYMRKYDQAALYADSCLQLKSDLIDYNALVPTANFPLKQFNAEVIVESRMPATAPISNTKARVNQNLYNSYDGNDLRKAIFFKSAPGNTYFFKGSYEGTGTLFSGLAVDEVYLIRAECEAREGKIEKALNDLNMLLAKRYKTGTYTPVSGLTKEAALSLILTERRKELLLRGLRWMDLKRQNLDGADIAISRSNSGSNFTLSPNSPRYSLEIPEDIIQRTDIIQNQR